ncbi:MAG: hypothetical protein E7349_06440 [Clostridiales bacterium]|nr:hypothetical protein [Clostridiales bacterium]
MKNVWAKIREFFERFSFMKWLVPLLVVVIVATPIAISMIPHENPQSNATSSEEGTTDLPDVDIDELIKKNNVATLMKDNKTMLVTFTNRDSREKDESQDFWFYSYVNGELWVDYRNKSGDGKTLKSGTYCPGVYYGIENEETYVQFTPQEDHNAFVTSFVALEIPENVQRDNFNLVDDELILRTSVESEDGYRYSWVYRFNAETLELNKAMSLVYRSNGSFVKSFEFTYKKGETVDWARVAYEEITSPKEEEVANVSVKYVADGSVTHSRNFTISKTKNLYAKDILNNIDYCVYADAACTQVLCDLSDVATDMATVYVSEAKEDDIATRDLKIAKRDNALSSVMAEHGKYLVRYTSYSKNKEKQSEQYWYYNANLAETADAQDGKMTLDYLERDENNTVLKVVNFRDSAFYTWYLDGTSAGKREFAFVLDADYENVLYAYGRNSMGEQTIKTPLTETAGKYLLTTTRKETVQGYKTSDWLYTFKKLGGKLVLQSIQIEYYSSVGELVDYAEVEIAYAAQWKANTTAYDRIAGNSAGTKIKGNLQIDFHTPNVRVVPYALNNTTYVSVYPSELGAGYTMYRHDLLSPIYYVGVLGQALDKDIYVLPTKSA